MNSKLKKLAAAGAATAILLSGGAAYAFWTTTGSGTGSGSVAASNGTLVLHGSIAAPLFPGGSSTVNFTADNASATDLAVGTVHLDSVVASNPGCNVGDFSMSDVTSNQVILAGATAAPLTATGTILFANSSANQDACKGATLTLNLTS